MRAKYLLVLACCVQFVAAQNLNNGLTACYPMNGNGNEPINLLTGTLSALTSTVDRFNNTNAALRFSGSTSSYLQLPNDPLIKPTTSLSISFWMRTEQLTLQHVIYAGNGCTSNFEGYCVATASLNGTYTSLHLVKASSGCSQTLLNGTTSLTPQTWYHVGAYFGNDSLKLYVNGVLESRMANNMNFAYSSQGVVVGGSNISFWNHPFKGSMDNMRFYTKKLSNQEFMQLYQNDPSCVDPMVPTTASFVSPDTVCVNQQVPLQNTSTGTINTNYWSVCNNTTLVTPIVSSVALTSSSGPVYMTINQDNGDYYGHVTGNLGGNLTRLYFGNSVSNTPTLTNLGTFSGSLSNVADLHIQKEGTNWYGIVVGDTYLRRLNFGTSLANTPTVINVGNIGTLSYPHSMHVFYSGGNYYALVTNYQNNSMTRLNFGSSLTNTPTGVNFSSVLSSTVFNFPAQMEVVGHNGNWHVFVMNDASSPSMTRLDFGNSLANIPTATVLGNPGSMLNGPRGMTLWKECGGGIKGLLANRNTNQLLSVSMPAGPTGAISLSSSGITGPFSFPNSLMTSRVGDTSVVYVVNVSNSSLTKLKYLTCNSMPSSTVQNPAPLTFTAPGNYTVSLATNEHMPDGSKYCKQLTVIANYSVNAIVSPTIACIGQPRTLSASGASSYTWYPGGVTGSSFTFTPLTANPTYTVVGSIGSCTAQQVFTVFTLPNPTVTAIASPTGVCQGNSSTITASGALTYSWQPGNSLGPLILVTPFITTTYTVSGTNSLGCIGSNTVTLVVTPYPVLGISPGTPTVCSGSAITLTATGAAAYTWTPGNVNTTTISVAPTANTIYTLAGVTNSCASVRTIQVNVVATPTVTASASSNTLCAGSGVVLSATGAGSYVWQPGSIPGGTVTVFPSANTTYTVTGATGSCTHSALVSVTVHPRPALTASASPGTICRGSTSTLSANNAVTYTWQPINVQAQTTTVSPFNSTIYTVSGTNSNGCVGSATVQVVVNPLPTISINPSSATICPGTISLSASGAGTYTWLPGNTVASSIAPTLTSTTVFTVNGLLNGCRGNQTSTIVVNPSPTVSIVASSPSVCFGSTVTFTASGASSYLWSNSQTGSMITVLPGSSQVFTVTGTNSFGCTRTATIGVTVAASPTITTTLAPSATVCLGTNYTISAQGANTYTWNTGNTGSAIILTAFSPTTTVYVVNGSIGSCTSSASRTVVVNALPSITAVVTPSAVCFGSTVNLTAYGANTYTWYVPFAVNLNNWNMTPTASSMFTVTGMSNGCLGAQTVAVVVNPNPTVTVSSSDNPSCSGSTVQLTANGASTYSWVPGNMTTQVVIVNPPTTTSYTVWGTNSSGCRSAVSIMQVVNPSPTITVTASPAQVCAGRSTTLTPSGGGPSANYTLHPGGFTGTSFIVTPLVPTTYTVIGRLGNCRSSATVHISQLPSPVVTAFATPSMICRGQSATLTAFGATNYTWVPGQMIGSPVVVTPTNPTLYGVRGMNAAGCTASANVIVMVNNTPTVTVAANPSVICAGATVTLSAAGAFSYTWQPGGMPFPNVMVTPNVTTTYTVTGRNAFCSDDAQVTVVVHQYPQLNIGLSSALICAGNTVAVAASGADNYFWMPGNINASSFTASPLSTTVYTLTGVNGPNCNSQATTTVVVGPKPVISAAVSASTLCAGSEATVVLSGAGGYLWNGSATSGSVMLIQPQATSTYTVIGFDGNGCSDTTLVNISVIPGIPVSITSQNLLLCSGLSTTLSATGAGPFTWMPGNISGNSILVSPSETTSFTVQSTGQCAGTAVVVVTVIACENPKFGVTNSAGPPLLYSGNYYLIQYSITVVNQSTTELSMVELIDDLSFTFPAPITYTVSGAPTVRSQNSGLRMNSGFNGDSEMSLTLPSTSTLLPMKIDTVVVSVMVDPHGFSGPVKNWVVGFGTTPWNAIVSDSSNNGFAWDPDQDGDPTDNSLPTIVDLKPITLFVPDAFSPDDDGQYDQLIIKGLQGRDASFTVFNRWGNKVYEASGPVLKWDGYANAGLVMGKGKVPPGVYYYVLQFTTGDKEVVKGFIAVSY